jgi:phage terminase Nu1 subunit (DNA packaging protein)
MFEEDLFSDEPRIPGGKNGGVRPNSGRKKGTKPEVDDYKLYAQSRAKKEEALAGREALKLEIETGKFVPRDDVRQASATAFAAISQTLRAIPDNLERRLGLQPEVAEEVSRLIDEAMGVLSEDLRIMCEKDYQ